MDRNVIEVEGVSKRYRLGVIGGATLADDLKASWAKLRGKPNPLLSIDQETGSQQVGEHFWALKGVDFAVEQGQILGIIGHNGAGKSTLLKLLSRITLPTEGEIRMKGRSSSLLEVGTGFHPELTGRENIFLNGAILGMDRAEIERKLDEIIDFSGIKHHIDTPTKRYSSGMKVRLGFAVAAHLEPEILIIDEVLAVGDADFQRKCLGKMRDVSNSGRTILFVSHNMLSVRSLCQRVIWMHEGKVREDGDTETVVRNYLKAYGAVGSKLVWEGNDAPSNGELTLRRFEVAHQDELLQIDQGFSIELDYENTGISSGDLSIAIHIVSDDEVIVFTSSSKLAPSAHNAIKQGSRTATCQVPGHLLNTGEYMVKLYLFRNGTLYWNTNQSISFAINEGTREGSYFGKVPGIIRPVLNWSIA